MKPTHWIAAALKILSIWLIVDAITRLPAYSGGLAMALYSPPQDPMALAAWWSMVGNVASWLTRVVIGVLMWRRSGVLAKAIWTDTEPETTASGTLTADRLQLIAFSIFGLFLLIAAAPNLLEQALTYRAYCALPSEFTVDFERKARLLGTLLLTALQIVLGLWLLLYPDGFSTLIRRLRDAVTFAGTDRNKEDLGP